LAVASPLPATKGVPAGALPDASSTTEATRLSIAANRVKGHFD